MNELRDKPKYHQPIIDQEIQKLSSTEAFSWLLKALRDYSHNKIMWYEIRDVVHNALLLEEKFRTQPIQEPEYQKTIRNDGNLS